MAINISEITKSIKGEVSDMLGDAWKDVEKEIKKFLNDHKADMDKWTRQCVKNEIDKDELEVLLRGLKSVAGIAGLKELIKAQVKTKEKTEKIITVVIEKLIVVLIASL